MRTLRFLIFYFLIIVTIVPWGVVLLLAGPFGRKHAYGVARNWCQLAVFMARVICGMTYRIEGKENFKAAPAIIFIKHSSTYETFVQLIEFPRSSWVLKRELLWIPIFGWALWVMRAIAIDRSAGGAAVKQVIEQGRDRLKRGMSIAVFPEGTRMPAGTTRRYGISGTLLAQETNSKIIPVAHNAGYHWPRDGLGIKPGEVVFVIGKPVESVGREPRELNAEIQNWIESEVARIVARQ